MQRPGKCCEECVSSQGNCLDGGTVRYHGEMWNGSRCDFCLCQQGKVTCQGAECAKVECDKVRKAFFCQDGPVKSWGFIYLFISSPFFFFSRLEALKEPALFCAIPPKNIPQGRTANLEFPMQVCTVGFHCEANQCESDITWFPSHAVSACCGGESYTQRIQGKTGFTKS